MNGFSFSEPDLLPRIFMLAEVVRPYRACAGMILLGVILCAGTLQIERVRVGHALETVERYQQQLDETKNEMQHDGAAFQRMFDTIALDREVRTITASGTRDARRLTKIAAAIPEHAWLTSIARIDDRLIIEGRARDLTAVAAVIRNLSRAPGLTDPELKTVSLVDVRHGSEMLYQLDVAAQ